MAASLDCSNVRNRNINHVTHHHQHQHAHHRRPMVTRDSSYEYNVSSHAKSSQCKMKSSTLSTSKTIVVISIVIGCFAILWPRMFYPMLQAAFRSQSTTKKVPYMDRTGTRGSMHPAMMHPRIREAMASGNKVNSPASDASRVPVVPLRARDRTVNPGQIREASNSDLNKLPALAGPGVMGLIMPIYSIVIVAFFLYTMFKLISKNDSDQNENGHTTNDVSTLDDSVDHCSNNHHGNYYYNEIYLNSIKRSPDVITSSTAHPSSSSSSSPFTKHVKDVSKEISKLASEYSNLKDVDDLVAGSSFAYIRTDCCEPKVPNSQHSHHSSSPSSSSRAQTEMGEEDDGEHHQVHFHRSPHCPVNNREQRDFPDDSVTGHEGGNNKYKSQLVHSQHSLRHLVDDNEYHGDDDDDDDDGDDDDDKCYGKQIKDVKNKLEEKEKIMLKLLSTIEGVGSKLVEAGILPAIPGLFSTCISSSSSLTTKTGDGRESNVASCDKEKEERQKRPNKSSQAVWMEQDSPGDSKLLEKQLAASTSFIASLGSGAKTLFSPAYRSSVVSEALRLLIQNMELFKSYLIEVENLRQRLNLLEMQRLSINYTDTNDTSKGSKSNSRMDQDPLKSKQQQQKQQKQGEEEQNKGKEQTINSLDVRTCGGDDDDDDDDGGGGGGDDDVVAAAASAADGKDDFVDGTTGTLDVEVDSESQLSIEGDFCKCSNAAQASAREEQKESQSEDSNYGDEIYVGEEYFDLDIAGGKKAMRNVRTKSARGKMKLRKSKRTTELTTCRVEKDQKSTMSSETLENIDKKLNDEGCNELNSIFNGKLHSNSSCNCCRGTCCCCISVTPSKKDTHLLNEEAKSKFDVDLNQLTDELKCKNETGRQVMQKNEQGEEEQEERTAKSKTKSDHRQESPSKFKQLATVATGNDDDDGDGDDEEQGKDELEVNDASKVPASIQVKSSSGIERQTGISTLVNSQEELSDKTNTEGKKIPIAEPHQSQSSKLHQIEVKTSELRRRNRKKRKNKSNSSRL